jgi:hypothetical protein
MIVALIALFVALGGAAYATQSQPRQNVLGAQIITRISLSQRVPPGQERVAITDCPTGYVAIGGGSQHLHDHRYLDNWLTVETRPAILETNRSPFPSWGESGPGGMRVIKRLPAPTGWSTTMRNAGEAEARFMVAAVCAKVVVDR